MLVYIIQTNSWLDSELENRYATLDKEVAKQLIKEEILDNADELFLDEQKIESFAQDLVDGNTDKRYCDEFKNVCIWCDIMVLQEK